MGVFERYTQEARRAIFYARAEAVSREASAISPAHLLLGLSREKDSIPNRLVSLRERLPELCMRMEIPFQPCIIKRDESGIDIPLTRDSKIALAYTAQEADSDWSSAIETDHLLRGLLRFPNEASNALNAVGVDLEGVRSAGRKLRRERASLSGRLRQILGFSWGILYPPLVGLGIAAAVGLLVVLVLRLINR